MDTFTVCLLIQTLCLLVLVFFSGMDYGADLVRKANAKKNKSDASPQGEGQSPK